MKKDLPTKMLNLMADGCWHSGDELIEKISHRFSATKHTLQKRGYRFERRHIEGQRYEYRLLIDSMKVIA